MIPVVFTHRGNQEYAQIAVTQAQRDNGRVVLLGDESNADWEVEHYFISDYWSDDVKRVADYYVHMCSNPHDFELYNLQEAFILREFMRRENMDVIFAADSDVMVYANLTQEARRLFGDTLAIYSIPTEQWEYRWSASAHSVYWTRNGLEAFCDFTECTYTHNLAKLEEKWDWHQRMGTGGGICDMTLLWLFYQEHQDGISDICHVTDGVAFDHNIRVAENSCPGEYRIKGELKEVDWRDGQPYCYHLEHGYWVRFATLHFQDGAKPLMKDYHR